LEKEVNHMPVWITAIGVGCIGVVCGYVLFYSFKRHQPPIAQDPLPISEVISLLVAVGAGGAIGGVFIALEGVNYIGAYGIGLLVGVTLNVSLTIIYERPSRP
jgi:hypothetical protein